MDKVTADLIRDVGKGTIGLVAGVLVSAVAVFSVVEFSESQMDSLVENAINIKTQKNELTEMSEEVVDLKDVVIEQKQDLKKITDGLKDIKSSLLDGEGNIDTVQLDKLNLALTNFRQNVDNDPILGLIPESAVLAFNKETCPLGWVEFSPAYGRFVRGIDKSGEYIDTDGQRSSGSLQADAFQGHRHEMDAGGSPGLEDSSQGGGKLGRSARAAYTNRKTFRVMKPITHEHGNPRYADETRPKNVALLYCEKLPIEPKK